MGRVEDVVPGAGDPRSGPDLVAALQRWQDFGAVWQVLDRSPGGVTVGLFRCDGGEEAGRFTSNAPELLAFVAGQPSRPDTPSS